MIRTIVSILVSFAIIFGLSFYELHYVQTTFKQLHEALVALYEKSETATASYEDGVAVQALWEDKREHLHIWMPHTVLQEIDYQLNETMGYLYLQDYANTLPKISLLIGITESVPVSYTFRLGNVF